MKDKLEGFEKGYKSKNDRITAYLIDLLLVTFLVTFLIGNSYTNPFYNNTNEAYKEFSTIYNEEKKNVDSSNEKEIIEFTKKVSPYYRTYYIRKYFASSLWMIILIVFYFGLFAYLNDGQTLGKKMFKVRVVNKDGKSAKFHQLVIRNVFGGLTLLAGNNLVLLLNIVLPFIKDGFTFTITSYIISLLGVILDVVFIVLFIFKKNGRTLDDLIGSTKVISVSKKSVSNNK